MAHWLQKSILPQAFKDSPIFILSPNQRSFAETDIICASSKTDNRSYPMRTSSKVILMVLLAWAPLSSFGQTSASIRIKGGWNTYAMSDLKSLQMSVVGIYRSNGLATKAVEQFPPYFSLQGQIAASVPGTKIGKTNLGLLFEILSTGGRVHYRDYSGEIRFDQLLSGFAIGTFVETEIKYSKHLTWLLALETSLLFSELENKQVLRVGRERTSQQIAFNAIAFAMQPRIMPALTFGPAMLGLSCGYQFSFPAPLKLSYDKRVSFVDDKNKKIKVNWSGIRLGILVGYNFQSDKRFKR